MKDAPPKREDLWGPRGLALAILTLALAFFIWRAYTRFVPAPFGLADEHGYVTTAQRLALHGTFAQHQSDPYAFIGETMMQSAADPTIYYLRQPIGYPLVAAAAYKLLGEQGPFAVNPLLGLALLVGIYRIGARLKSPIGGAIAAAVIGASTLVLYYTIAPLSHLLDMTLAVGCIAMALAWREERLSWQAGICGLLLGMAVATRYVSVLLLLPIGMVVWEQMRDSKEKRSKVLLHLAIAGVMMLPAMVPLLWYHAVAYGGIFRTGYSAGANATSFSFGWFFAHAPAMGAIVACPEFGLSAILLSAVIGICVLVWKRGGFVAALLFAWALPPLVVYTAYYGMPTSNMLLYARFALPSFVPLALLGTIWPEWTAKKIFAYIAVGVAAAVTITLNCAFNPAMDNALQNNQFYRLYALAVQMTLHDHVPAGSMVLCDNFTAYYVDYDGDYVVYDTAMFFGTSLQRRLADLHQTPHEFDPARTEQLQTLLGNCSDAQRMEILRGQMRKYAGEGRKVFVITSERDNRALALEQNIGFRFQPMERSMDGALDLFQVQVDATTQR